MDIEAGSLVYSGAGRDKGGIFAVMSVEGEYCYLCDGKSRKCAKPKKKKLKHVKPAQKVCETLKNKIVLGEKLTNAEIRKSIAACMDEQTG